ncbi:MAG: cobalt ECF transporter T component CbiQ, partial [Roseiflexaceae bacterium]|nr:cobalt ECF transporter T component CbiQ [Roseiflexaceae bacterium]
MHSLHLDRFVQRASPIHQLDPRVKVGAAVLFILSNSLLPDGAWLALLLSWAALLGGNLLARLGPLYTLRRSFVALPFVLAAVTIIFTLPGQPVAAFELGPWRLVASDAGLLRFASIVVRSWLSVQMAILLTATTSFSDLTHALRHLKVPALLVAIIGFMYRYLSVLVDEVERLLRARDSRSAALPGMRSGGTLLWRARTAGSMAGQLFLRSYERSDRVYNAMLARGFRGEFMSINAHFMQRRDCQALVMVLLMLIGVQVVGRA